MTKLILFGAAPLTRLLHYYIAESGIYDVCGFVVDERFKKADEFCAKPLVSVEKLLDVFPPKQYKMLVAVGYNKLNEIRKEKYLQMKAMGYELVNFVHPSNIIASNVKIGENTIILEDNLIQPFVSIGNNVLMFSKNLLAHDAVIEDHCCLSSRVDIAGKVRIAESCFFGVGAGVDFDLTVGEKCIVGARSWLSSDAEPASVYQAPKSIKRKLPSSRVKLK
ncbi:MAG: acetyltransferase [Candidatus Obscuribacterales bacterium]|nr:acetyltransferase [Candidatus Obscuribacterales bacterium]